MGLKITRKKILKSGFTTGTTATAAAKAALQMLLENSEPSSIEVQLLTGERVTIPVHTCRRHSRVCGECQVIKDAGDDPDITNGAAIGAKVELLQSRTGGITITGGQGVGTITKPGLEIDIGEPAINPRATQNVAHRFKRNSDQPT